MSETTNEAELGRSKHHSSPKEHLQHLLNVGWKPGSPLIQKFIRDNSLQKELELWIKEKQSS